MPKKYGKRKDTPNLHETELYDKVTKLQSSILSELESLNKKKNIKFDCVHCYEDVQQEYDPKKNYYEMFWKQYLMNIVLMKRYVDYRDGMKKITKKMANIENLYNQRKKIMSPIDSKRRKKNSDNDMSEYECVQCGKKYKDNDSLNIHLNIKHGHEEIKVQVITSSLLQAKIEELNHHYIDNSDSQQKNYYQEQQQ